MTPRVTLVLLASALLASCSQKYMNAYDGAQLPTSQVATISASGPLHGEELALDVIGINGKNVPMGRLVVYALPGPTTLKVRARIYRKVSYPEVIYDEAILTLETHLEANHTYLPRGRALGQKFFVRLEDRGEAFQIECLPIQLEYDTHPSSLYAMHRSKNPCREIPEYSRPR